MIKVILADDHDIVRSGIRLALQDHDIQIIAEAKTGEEAVLLAQQLKPDLVLMDIHMPGTDGFSASIQILTNSASKIKILVLSTQENPLLKTRLKQLGVSGYLTKNTAPCTLKKTIHAVYAGEQFFENDPAVTMEPGSSPFAALSDRELQIALMIVKGLETLEIANRLFISRKTVHGYRRTLLKKLGATKDTALTRLAIEYGLVDFEQMG